MAFADTQRQSFLMGEHTQSTCCQESKDIRQHVTYLEAPRLGSVEGG